MRGVLFDTYKRNPSLSPLGMQINDLAAAGWLKRIMTYHPYAASLCFYLYLTDNTYKYKFSISMRI